MADTTDKTSETTAAGSTATVKEPFYDIAKWATKAPEGEKLISTAYGDKVTEDLRYVKNEPGVHKPDPILVADNVTRRFGGMTAVDVQHFEIERHGITALIGPNGAGKSTLLKSLFGLVHIHSGKLTLKGQDITNLRADKLVSRGVGFVPQTENVFPSFTIAENMHMGAYQAPKLFNERFDYVCSIFPKLGDRRNQLAGQLSGGERQMVAMGRALMMQPSVLLLDEPSAGLSPMMQDETFIRVRQVNRAGVSVVIVEQNARRCLQICDRGYVLDQGHNAYSGCGRDLMNDPKVISLYLGNLEEEEIGRAHV